MDSIAFAPMTREMFIPTQDEGDGAAGPLVLDQATQALLLQLRRVGWPGAQRLQSTGPGATHGSAPVSGILVELVDALPILAAATDGRIEDVVVRAYCRAARFALDLVRRGRLLPTLRSRGGDRGGWEARWRVILDTPAERAELAETGGALAPVLALPAASAAASTPARSRTPLTGLRVLYRFLDACADTLVREACRLGAAVRLGHWPAGAWEQRLVRALGEDRPGFFCEQPAPETLAAELEAWVADQRSPSSLSLLPSPAPWQAPESFQQVLRRLVGPAGRLAEALQSGRPAPRMLPLTGGLPLAPSFRRAA